MEKKRKRKASRIRSSDQSDCSYGRLVFPSSSQITCYWIYIFLLVIINIIREINKAPKVDFKDLIGTIQSARRILSFELKNKELNQIEVPDEIVGYSRADRKTQLAVDSRMAELYNTILNFELN